jgi:hypothetical protein
VSIAGSAQYNGYGVVGTASWDSLASGQGGQGVTGRSTKETSGSYPAYDVTNNLHGIGVYGETDLSDGVFGFSSAPSGRGVAGFAPSATGSGVLGNGSPSGVGVRGISELGTGVLGSSVEWAAVYGQSTNGPGVYGVSSSDHGVEGTSTLSTGVFGKTGSVGQSGVSGQNLAGGTCNPLTTACGGVVGVASGTGVPGVRGTANLGHGVLGITGLPGLAGTAGIASSGAGCSAASTATRCYGVIGSATSTPNTAGVGVYGIGTYAGVYGEAANSNAFAGVFLGGVVINGGTIAHEVVPALNNSYDLGTASNRWRLIYSINNLVVSDLRLKKDVTELEPGLAEILDLKPVSYGLRDGEDERTHLGLIAQDVKAVLPQVVYDGEGDDPYSLSYTELIPVLIKAIQEQQAEIDVLSGGAPLSVVGTDKAGASVWAVVAVGVLAGLVGAIAGGVVVRRRV